MAKLLGIDVGSTTVKVSVIDEAGKILYSSYERHYSRVKECVLNELEKIRPFGAQYKTCITGSAGLGLAQRGNISFVQEVQSAFGAIKKFYPDADAAVELGGEDAKIIFITGGTEQRMNGSCAGGTGAFIDQMASLLGTDASGLNELAKQSTIIYPIASRCGVFAKSDIQPLINDGAKKADIAASVFQSVVNQTISGLACGKPIKGKVAFLGGPLHFLTELGKRFTETLQPESAIFPENSQVFNAIGAAYSSDKVFDSKELLKKVDKLSALDVKEVERLPALFDSPEQLEAFRARHAKTKIKFSDIKIDATNMTRNTT